MSDSDKPKKKPSEKPEQERPTRTEKGGYIPPDLRKKEKPKEEPDD